MLEYSSPDDIADDRKQCGMVERDRGEPGVVLGQLRKEFGTVVAVDGVSLTVAPGEFVTLLGPSGCGKTTTLRMVGGFETPTAGSIRIHGEEMTALPPYRRPVNTVFQNYALFPHMTVARNVGYGLEMAKAPREERNRRVSAALEMVRLPGVEERKPSELSGGQQQRVALARALVNRPKVLLLDEPLGALDLKLRKTMQTELKALNRETGAIFIYVTHDQEEALTMSDRIAVMNAGKILQIGTPADIYERPRTKFVADFIGQTNFLDGELIEANGRDAVVNVPGVGAIRGRSPYQSSLGENVTLAIRPERIALVQDLGSTGAPDGWNGLAGRVVETIYLGTHTQLVVDPGNGASIAVHRQNRAGGETLPAPGETVRIAFDPSSATVLAS
jgi:spermidine/putrescine transport system ATP-binding protein